MVQHAKPLFEDWIFSRHCLLSKTEWWSFCLFVCFWAPLLNTLNRSGFLTQAFNAGDGKKSCFDAKLEKHVLCKKTVRSIRPDWNRMSNSCFLARWACMATAAVGQSFLSIVTGKRRFCLRTRQLSPADYVKWRPIRFFACGLEATARVVEAAATNQKRQAIEILGSNMYRFFKVPNKVLFVKIAALIMAFIRVRFSICELNWSPNQGALQPPEIPQPFLISQRCPFLGIS